MTKPMNQYYFTFGANHTDCEGNSLGNNYTVVHARNEDEATVLMSILRGRKWSFCYTSEEKAGVERFNLSLVSLDRLHLSEISSPRGFTSITFLD